MQWMSLAVARLRRQSGALRRLHLGARWKRFRLRLGGRRVGHQGDAVPVGLEGRQAVGFLGVFEEDFVELGLIDVVPQKQVEGSGQAPEETVAERRPHATYESDRQIEQRRAHPY